MKLKALGALLAFVPALMAVPVDNCTSGAGSAPVFSISSTSGEVADYTLDCAGVPEGPPPPTIDVDAMLNVSILDTGGWILTDGTTNTPGTLVSPMEVEFQGVPFGLTGGFQDFTVEGIFVNPSAEGPGFVFNETDTITSNFSIDTTNVVSEEVGVNASTPEPSTILLVALGLGAMCFARKTRKA
ncbi:MAG TPA: PEP-CTERM sorting domain-containing protein [Verrucomicrobiae bacterium]|nr:PEP-CTERM sorting domain-containing protein [Verrucomicrobiae bacterium]